MAIATCCLLELLTYFVVNKKIKENCDHQFQKGKIKDARKKASKGANGRESKSEDKANVDQAIDDIYDELLRVFIYYYRFLSLLSSMKTDFSGKQREPQRSLEEGRNALSKKESFRDRFE